MTNAYFYRRWSSAVQGKGHSSSRQSEAAAAYAANNSLTLTELVDDGRSAFSGDNIVNGDLGRFYEQVRRGKVEPGSILIVENLDRLSRDKVRVALTQFLTLINANITVIVLDKDCYRFTPEMNEMEVMMAIMDMSRAHEESARKSRLIGDAMASKRKKIQAGETHVMTGVLPYGYNIETGKIVIDPDTAQAVKRAYELIIKGHTIRQLPLLLEKEGFKPRRGEVFQKSSLSRMLQGRQYLGEYQPHTGTHKRRNREPTGEVVKDYYPPLIDEQTWQQAQAAMATRPGQAVTHRGGSRNLFTGIMVCKDCRGSVHYVDKGKRSPSPKLVCSTAFRKLGCHYTTVSLPAAEAAVLIELHEHLQADDLLPERTDGPDIGSMQNQASGLKTFIKSKEAQLDTWTENALDLGAAGGERFMKLISKAEKEIERLKEQMDDVNRSIGEARAQASSSVSALADLESIIKAVVGNQCLWPDPATLPPKGTQAFGTAYVKWLESQSARRSEIDDMRIRIKGLLRRIIKEVVLDTTGKSMTLELVNGKVIVLEVGPVPDWWQSAPPVIKSYVNRDNPQPEIKV